MMEFTVSLDPMNVGCQTSSQKHITEAFLIASFGLRGCSDVEKCQLLRRWLPLRKGLCPRCARGKLTPTIIEGFVDPYGHSGQTLSQTTFWEWPKKILH